MECVLEHCLEYARPYIDDIIIFSLDWESHLQHVASVLKALKVAHLTANPLKCEWGGRQILYLGHVVGDGRLAVPEDRARAMLDYKPSKTKSGLRSFLGSISYYRRFIKNVANFKLSG